MAMYAAALIPLLGLLGGGIDMSRLYLSKTRLQQACDAGALAGRKQMAGGAWSTAANTTATNMFNANFQSGAYGTTGLTKTFSESGGTVTGTAAVQVPMAVMQLFSQQTKTIDITCSAKMEIPNTDVMFVLDNTGSMSDTNSGDTDTKINGLKKAVRCFFETLARIDTSANCGSTPSGPLPTAQLRFGFVPYSTNVRVGRLLNNAWIADNWTYQSRTSVPTGTYTTNTNSGSWAYVSGSTSSNSQNNQNSCPSDTYAYSDSNSSPVSTTAADGTITSSYTITRTETGINYSCSYNWHTAKYNVNSTTYNTYKTQKTVTTTQTPDYTYVYKPVSLDISGLKAGDSNWNNSVSLPIGNKNAATNVAWDGCIEERQTVSATSYTPIPSDAKDLDIDMIPSTGDPTTQWGPALSGAVWGRYTGSSTNTTNNVTTTSDLSHNISYYCPAAARKLKIYTSASDFDNYVGTMTPTGNTYHDIGLIWGARLLSPTGLFASENAFTPSGGEIQRHMIFMTDGDACTGVENYTAYGANWWDRRTTGSSPAPTDGCTETGTLTQQVNARTDALCSAIKNKNITLWVISFGTGVSTTIETRLQNCASPGKYFSAKNTATLISNFQTIANQISQLRLTN